MNIDIKEICRIARKAGEAILEVYQGDVEVEIKDDRSPLTAADRAAHRIIVRELEQLTPDIPILSEEGKDIPYEVRRNWERFWLVDPLDGTKEFIKKNGEFTVNISLIEGHKPILGVIHVPVRDKTYFGQLGQGSWVREKEEKERRISCRPFDPASDLTVVMSRSHPSLELETFLKNLNVGKTVSVGSSLKLCAVAEGEADIYPRLGPTMEWDTGAGQAIVESAGGVVETLQGKPLDYNKRDLLNPYFVARGA